jgi:hypothetical protein
LSDEQRQLFVPVAGSENIEAAGPSQARTFAARPLEPPSILAARVDHQRHIQGPIEEMIADEGVHA